MRVHMCVYVRMCAWVCVRTCVCMWMSLTAPNFIRVILVQSHFLAILVRDSELPIQCHFLAILDSDSDSELRASFIL